MEFRGVSDVNQGRLFFVPKTGIVCHFFEDGVKKLFDALNLPKNDVSYRRVP